MSQLFNPIQGKLSKMRSSQMLRCHTQTDNTPLKTAQPPHADKQNLSEYPLTQITKHPTTTKHAQSSLRKITLLQRKSIKKQQSIQFYRNQLNRRKKKYQDQLQKCQEEHQVDISAMEAELIGKMSKERELDLQTEILEQVFNAVEDSDQVQEYSMLDNLDDEILDLFESKLTALGIVGTQLLYSKETMMESMRFNKGKEANQVYFVHPSVQFVSSNKKKIEQEGMDFHNQNETKILNRTQVDRFDTREKYDWMRNQFKI